MTRVRDAVITVLCVAVLTPLLVLVTSAAGIGPRHWSGVPLSGVQLPFLESGPISSGTRPAALDEVTDALIAMDHRGWTAVYTGTDGLVHVEVTRLNHALLRDLGGDYGGDTVGLVYSPLTPPMWPGGPGDGTPAVETTWQRTDPVGTWVTLLIGFPWQLGSVLLLTAIAWALVLRRRRVRRAPHG
ncbi:hypothetical protein [Catellatospora sichuanensis]|uniref:hypothetical protein n=1 Tax=Catellatospora sichuanensis TaxID=1969805 RepID=UPI001184360D|nr:hypothetical protein [Catellatospora sichuanensis]